MHRFKLRPRNIHTHMHTQTTHTDIHTFSLSHFFWAPTTFLVQKWSGKDMTEVKAAAASKKSNQTFSKTGTQIRNQEPLEELLFPTFRRTGVWMKLACSVLFLFQYKGLSDVSSSCGMKKSVQDEVQTARWRSGCRKAQVQISPECRCRELLRWSFSGFPLC